MSSGCGGCCACWGWGVGLVSWCLAGWAAACVVVVPGVGVVFDLWIVDASIFVVFVLLFFGLVANLC